MNKQLRHNKYENSGKLERYLRREAPRHVYVEETNGAVRWYRAADFHLYFSARDPTEAFAGKLSHVQFQEGSKGERITKFKQQIPKAINNKDEESSNQTLRLAIYR